MTQYGHWLCIAATVLMLISALSMSSFKPIRCRLLSLGADMQRREFITLIGGAAVAWPLAARAQQTTPLRHVGVLLVGKEGDPATQASLAALREALAKLGWME